MMNVRLTRLSPIAKIPVYKTLGSAAADVAAALKEPLVLGPGERAVVPTGIALAVPKGFEAQVRARSGLSIRHGVCLANGIGTIDSDYRGEVGVILINLGTEPFTIEPGMRIAQIAIVKIEQVSWGIVDSLDKTERGEGGYGSTGN